MRSLSFIVLLGCLAFCSSKPSSSSEEEPKEVPAENSGESDPVYPYVEIHEDSVLEPGNTLSLTSKNYPDPAPADLRQSWSILTYSPDYPTKLKITCQEFDLPQSDPCEHFELIIDEDDNVRHNFCGEKKDFTFTSKDDGAVLLLATGPEGGGKINCQAEAIKAE